MFKSSAEHFGKKFNLPNSNQMGGARARTFLCSRNTASVVAGEFGLGLSLVPASEVFSLHPGSVSDWTDCGFLIRTSGDSAAAVLFSVFDPQSDTMPPYS